MSIQITHGDQEFKIGDTIRVNYKIKEKNKERIQAFDGILLSIKGKAENQNIVVYKTSSDNVKVERIFPINSPWIDSIKKLRTPKSKIRRSKLYYIRDPKARSI